MKKHTRREFLEKAILGAGAGVAFTAFGPGSMLAESQAERARGYAGAKYAIEIDGMIAGWVQSVEGGHATSDVVNEKTGPPQKHIAGVKYEDITVNCGAGMSKAFYEWIKAAFDGQYARKNGVIVACDYDYREVSRLEWFNGVISEVGLPALDAASKDAARMTIKIKPEYTRTATAQGGARATLPKSQAVVQKKWLPSNFRLEIGGLDCRRVNKIEAIVLGQQAGNPAGQVRSYQQGQGNRAISNLVVTLPESDAAAWETWHKSFVISGKSGQGSQKTGQLAYLTPDLRETLFTLSFFNLGIFKITPDKMEAGSENIRRVKVEMYCEQMKFAYGNGAWA